MAGVKGAVHVNVATAMAIAGRASRACDVCGVQRSRWYCEADNAYLCHRCDQSVHSANALARRHERVRLTPSSQTPEKKPTQPREACKERKPHSHPPRPPSSSLPSRKRSRLSRRPNPHAHAPAEATHPKPRRNHVKVKSEAGAGREESQEVPNFITVNIQESPISFTHDSATATSMAEFCKERVAAAMASVYVDTYEDLSSGDSGPDFLVPSGYLDDFESAIGAPIKGTVSTEVDDSFALDLSDEHYEDYPLDFSDIVGGEAFEGDCGETVDEGDVDACTKTATATATVAVTTTTTEQAPNLETPPCFAYKVKHEYNTDNSTDIVKKEIVALLRSSEDAKPAPSLLRLNFEDVLSAWSDRSLWTDGKRPQTVPDDSTSEATGCPMDVGLVPDLSKQGSAVGVPAIDGGREARVNRYREKRRTRLFSKKIRYEVRKLNAERRPRMKGRFVKRIPGC